MNFDGTIRSGLGEPRQFQVEGGICSRPIGR